MNDIDHGAGNGGPPLDADYAKLRWAKINITEILEGIEELSWEQRGYYMTALFKMYARMGGIPADDHEGAKVMRCDVRFFRRLRDQIISVGKFYVEDGLLKNSRVEREISEYVREFKRRSEAAVDREKRKRDSVELHSTSGRLLPEVSPKSPRSSREVSETSLGLEAENPTKSNDASPQPYHKPTTNQNQEPEPLRIDREGKGAIALAADAATAPIEALKAFEAYNAMAQRIGLPLARSLTPQRRKNLVARLREHGGYPAWDLALANIERSAFLRGNNQRGWRADLDFLLTASKFAKVVDGTYGNGAHAQPAESYFDRMQRLMGRDDPETPAIEILPPERRL